MLDGETCIDEMQTPLHEVHCLSVRLVHGLVESTWRLDKRGSTRQSCVRRGSIQRLQGDKVCYGSAAVDRNVQVCGGTLGDWTELVDRSPLLVSVLVTSDTGGDVIVQGQ